MSDLSITGFASKNAIPFILGATAGALGYCAVRWLREYYAPSSASLGTIHVILLTENGTEMKTVSCPEFRAMVTTDELNTLRTSVGWGERSEEMWQDVLARSTNIVCVKKDWQLVAYGSFVGNGRMGIIYDMHVHPDFQNRKIGTLMMNHLVDQIKVQKYAIVNLFGYEGNKTVVDFYAKFGFKPNPHGMELSVPKA